ncbi:MAG: 3-hydroxybutyryl-CoA dehydrogenase [Acidiferrobacteraceae bacterium]|nr:3-hydroxybutyryl-CoA dehydrogenase [Acidiferrobacteraceae bacterium]|tara:strand:- start:1723 stop:2673 length:951 start_codon:yes stop_codon:yes gene_type:complete
MPALHNIKRAAVIGLGTMGPGIVATLASGGISVSAYDADEEARGQADDKIKVARKVLQSLGAGQDIRTDITLTSSLQECVSNADLVIETIPENLELKVALFRELELIVSQDCILASDSSGIPVSQLQEGAIKPSRFVGMHWSNPPHIIPMIEVIAGKSTSPDVVEAMTTCIRRLKLIPVVVKKDIPGFVENRVLYALLRECIDLVDHGVIDAKDLDTCVSWGIGYKLAVIGPMALLDMAGLDIYEAVGSYLNKDLCDRSDVSDMIRGKVISGNLGMKTGQGIYAYSQEEIESLRKRRAKLLVDARKVLDGATDPSG